MRNGERICESLMLMLGVSSVHDLPAIAPRRPRWWQLIARAEENEINASFALLGLGPIDDAARAAYWREVNEGQGMDDAGGYVWRCWEAALAAVRSLPGLDPAGVRC